ncbi:MAG: FRG domain-containing protein [Bacteroidetes bacterium]|nr:FRG domain-containing protein [Bacteroidota bacterium]
MIFNTELRRSAEIYRFYEAKIINIEQVGLIDKLLKGLFVYRGQSDESWRLESSLERFIRDSITARSEYTFSEKWMLHEFKRKAHFFNIHRPSENNNIEWLSIIQHHGGPTRLIDFTNSFYVALFFASMEPKKSGFSVVGINNDAIFNRLHDLKVTSYDREETTIDEIYHLQRDVANSFIGKESSNVRPALISFEPEIFSERISRQQGLFVLGTDSEISFEKNAMSFFDKGKEAINYESIGIEDFTDLFQDQKRRHEVALYKLNFSANLRGPINRMLRMMNLNYEILFPGLDGLAKSLIYKNG